jgi:hypothetical protein
MLTSARLCLIVKIANFQEFSVDFLLKNLIAVYALILKGNPLVRARAFARTLQSFVQP